MSTHIVNNVTAGVQKSIVIKFGPKSRRMKVHCDEMTIMKFADKPDGHKYVIHGYMKGEHMLHMPLASNDEPVFVGFGKAEDVLSINNFEEGRHARVILKVEEGGGVKHETNSNTVNRQSKVKTGPKDHRSTVIGDVVIVRRYEDHFTIDVKLQGHVVGELWVSKNDRPSFILIGDDTDEGVTSFNEGEEAIVVIQPRRL